MNANGGDNREWTRMNANEEDRNRRLTGRSFLTLRARYLIT
jgi:hypothetical protein